MNLGVTGTGDVRQERYEVKCGNEPTRGEEAEVSADWKGGETGKEAGSESGSRRDVKKERTRIDKNEHDRSCDDPVFAVPHDVEAVYLRMSAYHIAV